MRKVSRKKRKGRFQKLVYVVVGGGLSINVHGRERERGREVWQKSEKNNTELANKLGESALERKGEGDQITLILSFINWELHENVSTFVVEIPLRTLITFLFTSLDWVFL